jgi:hypothetical protein
LVKIEYDWHDDSLDCQPKLAERFFPIARTSHAENSHQAESAQQSTHACGNATRSRELKFANEA